MLESTGSHGSAQSVKYLKYKGDGLEKMFMHQDLTPKQRRKRKELVEELKASQSQKEQNLIIVKDKIVTNSIFQSLCASFVPTRATCYRYGLMTKDISYSRPYASYI